MPAFGPAFFCADYGHVRDLKDKVPVRVSHGVDCDKPLLRVQWGFLVSAFVSLMLLLFVRQ